MKPKGLLLVLSGPSGAGKGTICQMLREKLPDIGYSVSVTTRAPREGEVDGVSYFFKTVEEVKAMIAEGGFWSMPKYTATITARRAIMLWICLIRAKM